MTRFVALLRAINVGGRQLPMADLRALAGELGLRDAATFIASGNLLFSAADAPAVLEARLEEAIAARFGFHADTIVRSAAQWAGYAARNPFPDAAPKMVHLGLTKRPPLPDAAETLKARAQAGERILVAGDAVWIDFGAGVARSKLTPAALDKAAGSPLTARNWNTVVKLAELLGS